MASTCSTEEFPFNFYDINGEAVSGAWNSDGICVFPASNCGVDISGKCCSPKEEYIKTGGEYMFIAFILIFITNYSSNFFFKRLYVENEFARSVLDKLSDESNSPWWVRKLPGIIQFIFGWGMWISVSAAVVKPIFMKMSVQANLDVVSRNVLLSAEAFLVPYKEIFQFIEDIVSVKVNYALRRGDKAQANQLVHAGLAGSFVTAFLASGLATILGVIPQVLQALTAPGLTNDIALYPGCDIIEASGNSDKTIIWYWLIEVWSFPGSQVGMVLYGFMMGALEIPTAGWIMSISIAVIPMIWFGGLGSSSETMNPLLLLSLAEFAGAWVFPILAILYMISPLGKTLRENTGVSLSLSKLIRSFRLTFSSWTNNKSAEGSSVSGNNDGEEVVLAADESPVTDEEGEAEELSMKDLLKDGLKIMFLDVMVQSCVSLTIYLALMKNGAIAYQLTALQSQLPTYGMAYAFGLAITFKIIGPMFIAMKGYQYFAALVRIFLVCAFLLVALIVGSSVPYSQGLAFDSGANACEYAGSNQCVPFFTQVFGKNAKGGTYTLPFTFNAFAFGSSVESVYLIVRAMLLTLMDLDFMVKSTFLAVIMYIVAIVVATQVQPFAEEAIAYFIAIYVPQITLIFMFLIRLEILIRRMTSGKSGTWSEVSKLISRKSTNAVRKLTIVRTIVADS